MNMIILIGGLGNNVGRRLVKSEHQIVVLDGEQEEDALEKSILNSKNDSINIIFGSAGKTAMRLISAYLLNNEMRAKLCQYIAILPFSFENRTKESDELLQLLSNGYSVTKIENNICDPLMTIRKYQDSIFSEVMQAIKV